MARSAYHSEASKRVQYTITPIGGKEQLLAWRLEQARLNAESRERNQLVWQDLRTKAIMMVATQEGQKLTAWEKAELAFTNKQVRDIYNQRRINALQLVISTFGIPVATQPLPLYKKLLNWLTARLNVFKR